jgi:hypothetical protein
MKLRLVGLWAFLVVSHLCLAAELATPPDLSTMTTPALPFPAVADLKPVSDPEPLVFLDGRTVETKED